MWPFWGKHAQDGGKKHVSVIFFCPICARDWNYKISLACSHMGLALKKILEEKHAVGDKKKNQVLSHILAKSLDNRTEGFLCNSSK